MLSWDERGHVLAACDEQIVYCRVIGQGNMGNCAPFQQYSQRMQQQGYTEFVLDFSSCEGLDSTFLGILLGIVIGDRYQRSKVVIVNPSRSVRRVLGEVGIDHLIKVCGDTIEIPEVPMKKLRGQAPTADERIGLVIEAHENLCQIEGENRQRFGRFLELIKAEIRAREDQEPEDPAASGDV